MFAKTIKDKYIEALPYTVPGMYIPPSYDKFLYYTTLCNNTTMLLVGIFGEKSYISPRKSVSKEFNKTVLDFILDAEDGVYIFKYLPKHGSIFINHSNVVIIKDRVFYLCESIELLSQLKIYPMNGHQMMIAFGDIRDKFGEMQQPGYSKLGNFHASMAKIMTHHTSSEDLKTVAENKKMMSDIEVEILSSYC